MEMTEKKKALFDIVQLEKERAEHETEISSKQTTLRMLNLDLEIAQEKYEKIERVGIKRFLLGLMGKRETSLQDAQNEVRKLRGEISNIEFLVSSAKNRIETIEEELQKAREYEEDYVSVLHELGNGVSLKQSFLVVREMPVLCKDIGKNCERLSAELSRAEEIYKYGDIHSDISGHKYNKRDSTLKEHTLKIKESVNELVGSLDAYNSLVPEKIQLEFREPWMDDESYWHGQQIAEDSYERVKTVDVWFSRFSYLWKKTKTQQERVLEQLRNELLSCLA